jgi:predicted dehydrogenase
LNKLEMSADTMTQNDSIGLGVVGCGGFGLFALQHYAQLPQIKLTGMAGTHREAAQAAAKRFGLENIDDLSVMLEREEVQLVYIATPPFLHYEQAMAALRQRKHVICEKPLATSLEQADEMIGLARERGLLCVANLMQRYNPLFDRVKSVIELRLLGELLHGSFENFASDEGLSAQHWFWDRTKSGGIFVEHGVHFFDLFAGWFGEGEVVAAQSAYRPGTDIEEHVNCTVRYDRPESIGLVNFYHGFHQPGRLDRQEFRLVFERGDITLHEWIPSRYRIHGIVDEEQTRELMRLFPAAHLDVTTTYAGRDRQCLGRHKEYDVYQMIEMTGQERIKMHSYGDLLRSLMLDQLAWIRDPSSPRRITEENGRTSLALALTAKRMSS